MKIRFLIMFVVAGTACGDPDSDAARHLSDLRAAKQKWQAADVANYTWTVQQSCFCTHEATDPVNVVVENGAVVSATRVPEEGDPIVLTDGEYRSYFTVDGLFDTVESAIKRDPYEVTTTFDADYGFPAAFYADYRENIGDDEQGYYAGDFMVATP